MLVLALAVRVGVSVKVRVGISSRVTVSVNGWMCAVAIPVIGRVSVSVR